MSFMRPRRSPVAQKDTACRFRAYYVGSPDMDSKQILREVILSLSLSFIALAPLSNTLSIALSMSAALALGQATLFMFNVGTIKFHKWNYCIAGHHVTPKTMIILEGLLRSVSCIFGWLVVKYTHSYFDNDMVSVLLGGLVNLPTFLLMNIACVFAMNSSAPFKADIHKLVMVAQGQPANTPAPIEDLDDAKMMLGRADAYINDIFSVGIDESKTVESFELVLIHLLESRGEILGVGRLTPRNVLRKQALEDPEERRKWLERSLSSDVWLEIRGPYAAYAMDVTRDQNDAAQERAKYAGKD